MRVASEAPRLPAVLTVATLALACAPLATCEREGSHVAPAIAASHGRYTVVWFKPWRGDGGSLEVQQFTAGTTVPLSRPRTILEREDLTEGGLELVAVGDGYLAITRVEDPEKKPSWATHILMVPLDMQGTALDDGLTYLDDYACHGAGVIGDRVVLATQQIGRSHRHPHSVLGLLAVDRSGNYVGSRTLARNAIACASAVHGGEIAVVWTQWNDTDDGELSMGLRVAFEEPTRDGRHEAFVVPVGDVDSGPVRIAPHEDGWAILYADADEHLHVAFVDRRGRLHRVRNLPRELRGESADLSRTERGLFVTARVGDRMRTVGVDGFARAFAPTGKTPSTTRAFGDGSRCVAAWTIGDAKQARIATTADCP